MDDLQRKEYEIPFNKYSSPGQSYISGATLQLTSDVKDFTTRTWTTGSETHIESLYPGTYTLSEITVPEGYKKADDITFTIKNDGQIEIKGKVEESVDMIDEEIPKTGSLSISKTVSGPSGDTNLPWTFTVTLSGDGFGNALNASYNYTSIGPVLHTEGDSLTDAENDGTGTILFTNGKATVKLKHGQMIKIDGLPAGIEYTVTETEANQNGYKTISTGSGGVIADNTTSESTFTNLGPVKLRIRKVDQDGKDILNNPAKFSFTNTSQILQTSDTSYGTETRALTQEIILQIGSYSVKETKVPDGYTTQKRFADGSFLFVVKGDMTIDTESDYGEGAKLYFDTTLNCYVLEITNTRNTGSLTVSKTVKGSFIESDRLWTFTVTLSGAGYETDLNKAYAYMSTGPVLHTEGDNLTDAENDGTGTIQFTGGKATVKLKHGQSITITGLPAGITYTVTEAESNQNGYKTTSTNATGTIPDSAVSEAAFTNLAPAKLRIRKVDQDWKDILNNSAEFTLSDVSQTLETTNTPSGTETWALSQEVTLAPGTYKVTETKSPTGYTSQDRFTNGTFSFTVKDDMTIDETADYGEGVKLYFDSTFRCYILEIANTKNTGPLTISKTVTGSAGDTTHPWTFTVTLSGSGFDSALNGTYDYTSTNNVQPGNSLSDDNSDGTGTITFTSGTATFSLKHNQSITITGLPSGITYTVAESESNQNGYTTTSSGETGTISEAESQASFTNTKEITAIFPDTGGTGTGKMIQLSILLTIASLFLFLLSFKRRHNK